MWLLGDIRLAGELAVRRLGGAAWVDRLKSQHEARPKESEPTSTLPRDGVVAPFFGGELHSPHRRLNYQAGLGVVGGNAKLGSSQAGESVSQLLYGPAWKSRDTLLTVCPALTSRLYARPTCCMNRSSEVSKPFSCLLAVRLSSFTVHLG